MTLGSDRPLVEPMVNVELVQDELDLGRWEQHKGEEKNENKEKEKEDDEKEIVNERKRHALALSS